MNIISKLLGLFDPASWLFRGVSALVLAGALWWAWTGFKGWVAAPMVIKAEAKKDDFYLPKLKAYEADFNGLTAQINQRIADTNAATAKKLLEGKHEADRKTKQYRAELAMQKLVADQYRADSRIELDSLRDSTKALAAGHGACGADTGNSGYANGLASRFASCARALTEAEDDLAEQLERADRAEAAVRALKQ